MQTLSAFLGVTALILAFSACSTFFKSIVYKTVGPQYKAVICMALIAAFSLGLKHYVVDNYAEVHDSDYRELYLITQEVGHGDFSSLVSAALEDGKLSKNEYSSLVSQVDTKYMDLDSNKGLNINAQNFTPIQLGPLERISIGLSVGLGQQVIYMGFLVATMLLLLGLFRLKTLTEDENATIENSPNKAFYKSLRIEMRKEPLKIPLIASVLLFGCGGAITYMNTNEGSNYKEVVDQFFAVNNSFEVVQELQKEVYANGKISMSEVHSLITLADTIEKRDIIKALK